MTQQRLVEAYKLIKAGQKVQAETQLRAQLDDEPGNADAWWLLANAAIDPAVIREALERDLQLRPDHDVAVKALTALNLKYPPPANNDFDDLFSSDFDDVGGSGSTSDLPDWFDDDDSGSILNQVARPQADVDAWINEAGEVEYDEPLRTVPPRVVAVADKPLKKVPRRNMHQAGVFWGSVGVAALLILAGIYALMQQATNAVTDFADQYAELQRASLEGHPHYYKTNAVDDNGLMAFGDKRTGTVELPFPDQWKFNGNSGQRVSIEAFSIDGAFDPILYLYDPAGHLLAINDDIRPGVNTNARLRITLPEDGRYSILICACYGPGRYRLELE